MRITTVWSSLTVTSSTSATRLRVGEAVAGSRHRSSEYLTSWAVSDLPLWNFTPRLSLKV